MQVNRLDDAIVVMQMSKEDRLDLLIKLIPAYKRLNQQLDQLIAENYFLKKELSELKVKGVGN